MSVQLADIKTDAASRHLAAIDACQSTLSGPDWLQELRSRARARFEELGFPTIRDEEWKYTDVTPIAHLHAAAAEVHRNGASQHVEAHPIAQVSHDHAHLLVFVNGHFAPQMSNIKELPAGVWVGSLAQAIEEENPIVRKHLGRYATKTEDDAFTALNTACVHDGAFIHVPDGAHVELPIKVLWMASGGEEALSVHPRGLFVVGRSAQATIVELFADNTQGVHGTNSVSEVVLGENAHLDHYKVQGEGERALHVATLQVEAQRDSDFRSHTITLGGRLVRNNANAVMSGENIHCTLNGLVLGNGQQHVDNHTVMDHASPHCTSHELYAHVLDDNSTAVFNGKIFVRIDAQKTDAVQSNRSLLLSPNATINTKPQLEILADDVKCTHGATIGQLDEAALFYLRARGISETQARALFNHAFAEEVLAGVRVESLRERLEGELLQRLQARVETSIL